MSLTLTSTLSGEFSNSYVTLDYADDYWADHYDSTKVSAWAALTDEAKTTLLILACRTIEKYKFTNKAEPYYAATLHEDDIRHALVAFNDRTWEVFKYALTQKLQFPRSIDIAIDGTTYIPEEVMVAQCEQALYLQSYDMTAITKSLSGISAETVGLGRGAIYKQTKYADVSGGGISAMTMLAPIPVELLGPLMLRRGKLRRA